jgi:hypothetical protein
MSYDSIVSRSLTIAFPHELEDPVSIGRTRLTVEPRTVAVRISWRLSHCANLLKYPHILVGYLATIGALIFYILAGVGDMTAGYRFTVRAYVTTFIVVNSFTLSVTCSCGIIRSISISICVGLLILNGTSAKTAWKASSQASRDPLLRIKWKQNGIYCLLCYICVLMGIRSLITFGVESIIGTTYFSMVVLFAILCIGQHTIMGANNDTIFDYEAQSGCITAYSRRSFVLDRMRSTKQILMKAELS